MDKDILEGLLQLGDQSTYQKLHTDPTPELQPQLGKLVTKMLEYGTLSKDMANYSIPDSHKLSRLKLEHLPAL
jgi:hypothetical protein